MTIAPNRRQLLAGGAIGTAMLSLPGTALAAPRQRRLPAFFDDLEKRTFQFFWDTADPETGLAPDRWPSPSFSSIAAVGFALTAWPLGVERGWVSREAARDRTLTVLRFLTGLPSGDAKTGVAGHRGFFYHFLHMKTGLRHQQTELSTVDTGLMHLGMLFSALWFDSSDPGEAEIRRLANELVDRAEWNWFERPDGAIPMGWHPERGFIDRNWDGYNEGMLVYLLALGSRRHPISDKGWSAWTAPYPNFWRGSGKLRRLAFAPMFGHQYSQIWIDFRGIQDAPMRAAGFDYFENSRRATLAQRAYAAANPMGWSGYDDKVWGLTACDGPGHFELRHDGHQARYESYSARGPIAEPDGFDDGTIAPTAMLGSLPFAPEAVIPSAQEMARRHGAKIYDRYGFKDSFNPSFRDTAKKSDSGTIDAVSGWVATDYLGIDQGPILAMLANYRSEAVWRVMRRSDVIVRGLRRAGFSGGWLRSAARG